MVDTASKGTSKLVRSKLLVTMTGESAFVMDNVRAADGTDPITVKVKELAGKGSKMTSEDAELKDRLQWRNGLYQDEAGRLVYPGRNLWVALAEAAKARKLGAAVLDRGGVLVADTDLVFGYAGPDGSDWTGRILTPNDLEQLYKSPEFRLRVALNGNPSGGRRKSMIMRMRAVFMPWRLQATVVVSHGEVGMDDFTEIVEAASRAGIGNGRKIGMGRFTYMVTDLEGGK